MADAIRLSGTFTTTATAPVEPTTTVVHVDMAEFDAIVVAFPNGDSGDFMGYDTWTVTGESGNMLQFMCGI